MTVRNGADASSVVTSAQMRAYNLGFVARYFSQYPGKNLTRGEVEDLSKNGYDIVAVYEDDVNDYASGYNGGQERAHRFLAQAAMVGMPLTRPCYFAVDENIDPNDTQLHEYFAGISNVLGGGRRGAYASTGVLRKLKELGLIDFTWRTMSYAWIGGAGNDGEFNIVQNGWINSQLDKDQSWTTDFGQWRLGYTPTMPHPEPIVHLWILDMCAHEDPNRPAGQTTNALQVEPVQNALVAEGFLKTGGFVPGRWDHFTLSAYAGWQGKCGYRGRDADGIPGMTTLSRLSVGHGFHVVS